MNKIKKYLAVAIVAASVSACGASSDKGNGSLAEKQAKLAELQKQRDGLDKSITELQKEIDKQNPQVAKPEVAKLVALSTLSAQNFNHYIDLQGKVVSDDVYFVSPRNGGGLVKTVYVKEGDYVKKGQQLLKLDDAVYIKSLKQLQTQLVFAQDLYNRRKNLWDQKIGTEVELNAAKNSVDGLNDQIETTKEQWSMTNVYSDVDGIVEEVNVRPGEFFTGIIGQSAQIGIVNNNTLKVEVQVPETYLEKVHKGSQMIVTLPDANQTYNLTICNTGNIIDPNSRSFYVEAKLPSGAGLKPNQVAQVKILDYSASQAIAVPVNVLQTDENGKFVLASIMENGKMTARKKQVTIGQLYGDNIEIKSGLQTGDIIITKGYESVYDGQLITDK